ncbi:hypothetical protein HKD37_16G045663 [Glycine soja]
MWFGMQFFTPLLLGFARQFSWREKNESHEAIQNGGLNLLLSDVWEPYQSNQRKKLRNLKKPLDMPL